MGPGSWYIKECIPTLNIPFFWMQNVYILLVSLDLGVIIVMPTLIGCGIGCQFDSLFKNIRQ